MMTLEEAIRHCEEKAKEQKAKAESNIIETTEEGWIRVYDGKEYDDCLKCAKEHEQLAEWLKELKDYREGSRTCENCKHERKAETEYPCSICKCNHPNKFEWKGGAE